MKERKWVRCSRARKTPSPRNVSNSLLTAQNVKSQNMRNLRVLRFQLGHAVKLSGFHLGTCLHTVIC